MADKKLKSLNEWNQERFQKLKVDSNQFNGISCPDCGSELIDSEPGVLFLSDPPKKSIKCIKLECNYTGYRLA